MKRDFQFEVTAELESGNKLLDTVTEEVTEEEYMAMKECVQKGIEDWTTDVMRELESRIQEKAFHVVTVIDDEPEPDFNYANIYCEIPNEIYVEAD